MFECWKGKGVKVGRKTPYFWPLLLSSWRSMLERAAVIRVCLRVAGGKEVAEQAQEMILLPAAPSLT